MDHYRDTRFSRKTFTKHTVSKIHFVSENKSIEWNTYFDILWLKLTDFVILKYVHNF